jgi:hypothetical protein
MLSRLDQFLAANVEHWTPLGNPYARLPTFRPEAMPKFRLRVLKANWRVAGRAVELDEVVDVEADVAGALVQQKRATYCDPELVRQHYANRRGGTGR